MRLTFRGNKHTHIGSCVWVTLCSVCCFLTGWLMLLLMLRLCQHMWKEKSRSYDAICVTWFHSPHQVSGAASNHDKLDSAVHSVKNRKTRPYRRRCVSGNISVEWLEAATCSLQISSRRVLIIRNPQTDMKQFFSMMQPSCMFTLHDCRVLWQIKPQTVRVHTAGWYSSRKSEDPFLKSCSH